MNRLGFSLTLSLGILSATGAFGVSAPTAFHHPDNRWYTGIPSLTVSPVNGRLWATWYTSLTDQEDSYNYCILATSTDDGMTWKEVLVADPDGVGPLRAFDPEVWVAPDGKLKWTWTERRGTVFSDSKNDKLQMVSLSAEDEPAAPYPAERTIARGVMMCKPIAYCGEWLFPVAHWGEAPSSCIYATRDGVDFRLVGGATIPDPRDREYDETTIAEMPDGRLRMFIRGGQGPLESFSSDAGRTWTEARRCTAMTHSTSRLFILRLKSGNLLMVRHGKLNERIPDRGFLMAYVSRDGGDTWEGGLSVDARNYLSYQDGCELADGRIAIVYDRERFTMREVLMATFTEADVLAGRDVSGKCTSGRIVSRSCTGGTGIDPRAGRYLLPDGNQAFRLANFAEPGDESNAVVTVSAGAKPTVEWLVSTWPRGATLRWDKSESTVSFPKIAESLRAAANRPVVRLDLNLTCHKLEGAMSVLVVTDRGVFETPYTEDRVKGGVTLRVDCPAPPKDIRFKLSGTGWFTLRFVDEVVPPLTEPRRVCEFNPTPVVWEKSLFDEVPATYPAFGRTNAVETLYYDGVPFHGKPTRVFAYMGIPKSADGKPVPGMVLVHGGGGSAFHRWVKYWNDQGYAAIAMDLCGCVSGNMRGFEQSPHARHEWAGPRGMEGWHEMNEQTADQWAYHAVAAVIRANTLLRAQPGVDKDRIGLTGISWGGFLSCIVSGIDGRFRFAAPVYGCGFIRDHSMWKDRGWGGCATEALDRYMKLWDPAHYVPHATMPIVFVDSTSDHAYPIDIVEKTAELTNAQVTRVVDHQFGHGHFPGSENRPEIRAFADGLFGRGPRLPRATRYIHMGGGYIADFDLGGMKVRSAELMYTTDKGDTRRRKWQSAPAKRTGGQVSGRLPAGVTGHYVKLVTESGLIVTTPVAIDGPYEDIATKGDGPCAESGK